jgi:hypothetical protein
MQCDTVPGNAAMRRLLPEPDTGPGWQLQLGLACTGAIPFTDWWAELTWPDVPQLRGGGGCRVTADAPGTYTVLPDNGAVACGQRTVVALRVLGADTAPAAVQFHATPRTGAHVLVRCTTVAVRTATGSAAATPATWPGIDTCDRGRTTTAPWHDWVTTDPAERFTINMTGLPVATDRNVVQEAINRAAGFARGGLVRQPTPGQVH